MVKHVDEHFLKCDQVKGLLKGQKIKGLGKNEQLWLAKKLDLISEEQLKSSLVNDFSVIKCSLYTHVTDTKLRDKLESYVRCWSRMYCKGSLLANLLAQEHRNVDIKGRILPEVGSSTIFDFVSDEDRLKQCFWPERWPSSKLPREPMVQRVFDLHSAMLNPICPDAATRAVMKTSGWDQALNRLGSKYRVNIQVHVCEHLKGRIADYIRSAPGLNEHSNRTMLVQVALGKPRPSFIAQEDYEWVSSFKQYFDVPFLEPFPCTFEFNSKTWILHEWLAYRVPEGKKQFSLFPVSKLNRKYAYVDAKVARFLFGAKEDAPLGESIGISRATFNKRRNEIRKRLKKKYSGTKLHRKWRKIGHGCFPKDASLHSVETDGVGLSLYLETVPQEVFHSPSKEKFVDPLFIGIDEGRKRIFVATDSDGRTTMLTRKNWLYQQHQHIRRRWEKSRKQGTAWGEACEELSAAGGFKNVDAATWQASLQSLSSKTQVYLREHIDSKERALMNMRSWRWKRQALDRAVKKMLAPAIRQKRPVVLGVGDATFPSTGKGEQSVPTKQVGRAYIRCQRVHGLKMVLLPISEYNTTKCCHRCGLEMKKTPLPNGNESLRYRTCTQCDKRRNRDVNASKNMLMLCVLMYNGLQRPQHLCCSGHGHA